MYTYRHPVGIFVKTQKCDSQQYISRYVTHKSTSYLKQQQVCIHNLDVCLNAMNSKQSFLDTQTEHAPTASESADLSLGRPA